MILSSVVTVLLSESHTLPLKWSISQGVPLTAKMPISKIIMHVCPSCINWFPTPSLEYSLFHLRLAQKCQIDSWQSYLILCNKLICKHNLNLTLFLTFSSTMLLLGCCWLQGPSSVTENQFSFSGVLSSTRKVYNTLHPSISLSIWVRPTLKLQCLLPH